MGHRLRSSSMRPSWPLPTCHDCGLNPASKLVGLVRSTDFEGRFVVRGPVSVCDFLDVSIERESKMARGVTSQASQGAVDKLLPKVRGFDCHGVVVGSPGASFGRRSSVSPLSQDSCVLSVAEATKDKGATETEGRLRHSRDGRGKWFLEEFWPRPRLSGTRWGCTR